jgi:hypothetical protein
VLFPPAVIVALLKAFAPLFSLVTLLAHEHHRQEPARPAPVHMAAWHTKTNPTFSDAPAHGRRHLWSQTTFPTSPSGADVEKVLRALFKHLVTLAEVHQLMSGDTTGRVQR